MASTGLSGPFKLSTKEIEAAVKSKSPGTYALGYTKDGTFYVDYVGRADVDVKVRLMDHATEAKSTEFKYGYNSTAEAAFAKECQLFHDFPNTRNKVHPARPTGSKAKCPVCSIFD